MSTGVFPLFYYIFIVEIDNIVCYNSFNELKY